MECLGNRVEIDRMNKGSLRNRLCSGAKEEIGKNLKTHWDFKKTLQPLNISEGCWDILLSIKSIAF